MLRYLIRYRDTILMNLWVRKPAFDPSLVHFDLQIQNKADRALDERMKARLSKK